ncbi:ATP-binding cassette domain-containing protein, partial [Escherichia coli]|uniref:ATP-binding cassette domain-containing protein n=1 Tax=Escherichia coli TaxID=562 RepID=UPI0034E54E64
MPYLLEMKNITKTFGSVKAIDNVCLRLNAGEIVSLCGENGSGKSTLMKVLCGIYPHGSYGNDSNLLIVFYVQIMPDDFVM